MRITLSLICLILVSTGPLLGQSNSDAQPRMRRPGANRNRTDIPRGYVVLGGTYSGGTNDFSSHSPLRTNAEDGSYDVDYSVGGGPGVSIGAAVRVWRQVGVRVGVTRSSTGTPSTLAASVAHPFFFNRFRSTSGEIDGLNREETVAHLHVAGMFPVGRRGLLSVFAGPSLMRVGQGTVQTFSYSESYPYDEITFGQATTVKSSQSKAGFGGGAEFSFFFHRVAGLAVTAQFAGATMDLAAGHSTVPVKVGGPQAGVGLVLRIP
jgi:hypothetical protein